MSVSPVLPPNYVSTDSKDSDLPSRYLEPGKLADGGSAIFRLCGTYASGHVIAGYSYFTMEGQPRRFPEYPSDLSDIGLSWAGKQQGTGEKAKPSYFLSWAIFSKEQSDFMVLTITQAKIREQLEKVLAMEDYEFLPSGLANFYLTLSRSGTKDKTSYTLIPTLKAPSKADEKRWAEAKDTLYLPALFEGGDPFAGPVAQPESKAQGLAPTVRDELGADHPIEPAMETAGW